MSDSILALTGLPPRSGASIEGIEAAERDLGVRLPSDHRAFLLESDGIEGFSGPEGDYLVLWSSTELPQHNRGYQVGEFAPGLTLIGSNGGGDAFGFIRREGKTVYVRLPFIPMDLAASEVMGDTLLELVRGLRGEKHRSASGNFDAIRFEPVREALRRARAALPASAEHYQHVAPGEEGTIGTLDNFDELLEQYEQEVALYSLAEIGRAVAAPPEFWSALDDAGRLMGFDEAWRARECRP